MEFRHFVQLIAIGLQARIPMHITGFPGVGKTEFAKSLGVGFARAGVKCKVMVLIGSIREPQDFGGFPVSTPDGVRLLPMAWARDAQRLAEDGQSRPDSQELFAAIAEFERFAEDYRELERVLNAPLASNPPPEVRLPTRGRITDLAEDVAARERDRLQLGDQPILSLRRVLEQEVGVRVFFGRLPSWIAGMYAYASEFRYCVFINESHPPERQRMSMAHEYAHFLVDRYHPGIDYLERHARKPANERFAEGFGLAFLMPGVSLRRYFNDIVNTTGDFRVADLVRLAQYYFVSAQAAVLRLEQLGLIGKGWWDHLAESGFRPHLTKHDLNLQARSSEPQDDYPERYLFLAVQAFQQHAISEGQLARFLRTDRVTARGIVESCLIRRETQSDGGDRVVELPFERSLLANAQ